MPKTGLTIADIMYSNPEIALIIINSLGDELKKHYKFSTTLRRLDFVEDLLEKAFGPAALAAAGSGCRSPV